MAAATAAVLALGFASPAGAAGTQDASVPTGTVRPQAASYQWLAQMAQTFKPTRTGQLDRVGLFEGATGVPSTTPTGPRFTLQIWTVDTTQPNTLAHVESTPPSFQFQSYTGSPDWHYFDLSTPVAVTAGTQYAIVVLPARSFTVKWSYMTGWTYNDGNQWLCCGWTKSAAGTDFAFQTFVTGGTPPPPPPPTNGPPTVSPDATAVTAQEGMQPQNAGSYADPDGDNVSLSSTFGSVTPTTAGRWSWTQPASDETTTTETVVVTADDGHGHKVTTQFTVDVTAVQPTAVIGTAQAAAQRAATAQTPEGTPLFYTGSAHSQSPDDNTVGFSYTWSVTKDGAPYGSGGTGASFNLTPNDEGTYVITLSATDDGHMTGTTSVTANISDVRPTALINSVTPAQTTPRIIVPYENITFSGSFIDPGTGDPHTASWNFGDGSPAAGGWTVTHFYTAPGNYSVTLTVSQGEDPAVGATTYTVTVQTTSQAVSSIAAYVRGLSGLNNGQKNSLIAKLNAAGSSADRGNDRSASNQLDAFLNEVRADANTGKLTATQASNLTSAIHTVKGALGTYNRFLEWWPLGL